MKLMKNKAICRRVLGLALSAAMALSLAACGNSSGGETEKKEWVWVPEFITIDDENVSFYDMQLVGDSLCYQSYDYDEETETSTQSICRYSLADTIYKILCRRRQSSQNLQRFFQTNTKRRTKQPEGCHDQIIKFSCTAEKEPADSLKCQHTL